MLPNPLQQLSLEQLRKRTSMKWRQYPQDVLPLWVAEMDVPLAQPIASAVHEAIDLGDTGYPAGTAYAEAFAEFAAERWGWMNVEIARTAVVPGVMGGVVEALRLISHPGDVVIVTPPVYAPFYAFAAHAGWQVSEAPLGSDGRLDFASLDRAFVAARAISDSPVLLLSNPQNPTGVVHTRQELERLAALAHHHGIRVISDEIHAPLVLAGAEFTPYLSVDGTSDGFAVVSASKGWNLAGLKAALLIAGEASVDELAKLPEEVSHGPSHVGVLAHSIAFREGGEWLDALLAGLDENREHLALLIEQNLPSTRLVRPEATYLAWLDCTSLGLEPHEDQQGLRTAVDLAGPAEFFVRNARVAVSSGHVFGAGGRGHVRINFATSPAILTEAVVRMGDAVSRLRRD
jgi:cystathionine beta-lyase